MDKFRILGWPFTWEFLSGGTPQASPRQARQEASPGISCLASLEFKFPSSWMSHQIEIPVQKATVKS